MSFLGQIKIQEKKDYTKLGYLVNPFPTRGAVREDVYVARPEAKELQQALVDFLFADGPGMVFAIGGVRGVGKSNMLRHIEWEIHGTDGLEEVACRYIASQLAAPRHLAEELLLAIGAKRIHDWLRWGAQDGFEVPSRIQGTDLQRFLKSVHALSEPEKIEEASSFLLKWLAGNQTYATERKAYNLWDRDRLQPALSFSYIQTISSLMIKSGHLKQILLLIDEAEDIAASKARRDPYALALKGLINSFNFKNLFIIIAGQLGSMRTLGQRYSSLADRWQPVTFEPLRSQSDAIDLALAYQRNARIDKELELRPSELEVRAIYDDLAKGSSAVTQRRLLDALRDWVERKASISPSTN